MRPVHEEVSDQSYIQFLDQTGSLGRTPVLLRPGLGDFHLSPSPRLPLPIRERCPPEMRGLDLTSPSSRLVTPLSWFQFDHGRLLSATIGTKRPAQTMQADD